MNSGSISLIAPSLLTLYGLLMVLLVEIITPRDARPRVRDLSPTLTLLTLGFALASVVQHWKYAAWFRTDGFSGMIRGDAFALFVQGVLCVAGLLGALSAWRYLRTTQEDHGEYYALLLTAVIGGMLMAGAGDLIMVFLGLETLSISLYAMAGFLRRRLESGESAIKYFFLGAFATGFFLYGVALTFGATGSTNLAEIGGRLSHRGLMASAGLMLLLVGFGFKIAAFPFQAWTPDVYQGAPSPATGFMAAAVKAATFAALVRVLVTAFEPLRGQWAFVLYYLAIATMLFGNVAALVQNRLKRLLAYSSIAHAGYLLVGVTAMLRQQQEGARAVLFYLAAYTLMTLGAFAVVAHLSRERADADDLAGYRGLARRHPWLAAALAIFLVSMAGLPPLLGFAGKFYLFRAAVRAGMVQLAVIGVLTSAISVYYYIRVIYLMYMTEAEADAPVAPAVAPAPPDWPGRVAVAAASLLIVVWGLLPHTLIAWASEGAARLAGR